jgi:ubiquinone/menaquinone biosynthesis C-methylase UbiE
MNFFETDKLTALESKEKAQWIAFAPVVFQTAKVLRNTGILKTIQDRKEGLTLEEVVEKVKLPHYGVRVLMEAGLGTGLLTLKDNVYKTTKTAYFLLNDKLTQVNLDFVNDVCYNGLFFLEESIRNEKPEGLKVFGNWPTIYEGLSKLPKHVQKSWFDFDHFFSDNAFPEVLQLIFKHKPKQILDIGGNTGRWSIKCVQHDPDVTMTIMDLPGQVGIARQQIKEKGFADRIHFFECNLLDETQPFPTGFETIWMSQFLDCFSDNEIISILKRCRKALKPGGCVYILEAFWDRQQFEVAAFSLQQLSLYFTALANGNSQMYDSKVFIKCVEAAGFEIAEQKDMIGLSHTLLTCKAKA